MYRLYTSDNGFIFVFDGLRTVVLEGFLTIEEKYSWFLANIEFIPICSMYGIFTLFTNIFPKNHPNLG